MTGETLSEIPARTETYRGRFSRLLGLGVAATLSALSLPSQAEEASAAAGGTVEIGMPFDGRWGSNASGTPETHWRFFGSLSLDIFANDQDTFLEVDAPSGGTLGFTFNRNTASCEGRAGEGVVVGISLGGEEVGQVYYEHLEGVIKSGPISDGAELGTTNNWGFQSKIVNGQKRVCYDPGSDEGVHTHFEAKPANGFSVCWYDWGLNTPLTRGTPIFRFNRNGESGQCSVGPKKGSDTVGSYQSNNSIFYLKDDLIPGAPNVFFQYGGGGWTGIKGDWDGNGTDTIGVFNPATAMFYLRNSNTGGGADAGVIQFGANGWEPLAGNWDGVGADGIGVYDPVNSTFYLRNKLSSGPPNVFFQYGSRGWKPIVGDWDGNGTDTIGVFNPATAMFYLRNSNTGGGADYVFQYGGGGWTPLTGDWDGDGVDSVGVVDPVSSTFYLRNGNSSGGANAVVQFGVGTWKPIVGDWDGK